MEITSDKINQIKETIKMIQLFMKLPEIKQLKKNNNEEYVNKLTGIFPSFAENNNSLFTLVINDADLNALDFMFETMMNISKGNVEKEKGEMAFGDFLATKYVKSKIDPSKLQKI